MTTESEVDTTASLTRVRVEGMSLCIITGCDKERHARRWCTAHYSRWWRHGDPETPKYVSSDARPREFIVLYRYLLDDSIRMQTVTRRSRMQLPLVFQHSPNWEVLGVGLEGKKMIRFNVGQGTVGGN